MNQQSANSCKNSVPHPWAEINFQVRFWEAAELRLEAAWASMQSVALDLMAFRLTYRVVRFEPIVESRLGHCRVEIPRAVGVGCEKDPSDTKDTRAVFCRMPFYPDSAK